MKNFAQRILISFLLVCCGLSLADDRLTHGQWTSDIRNGNSEAYTSNESGSVLGLLCGPKNCRYYYTASSLMCDSGSEYVGLMTSINGAASVNMMCALYGKKVVLFFDDFKVVEGMLVAGGTSGLAIALASGLFNVSRFPNEGAAEAINRARNSTKTDDLNRRDDMKL